MCVASGVFGICHWPIKLYYLCSECMLCYTDVAGVLLFPMVLFSPKAVSGKTGNSGQQVKVIVNHEVHTLFLVSVVSMSWEFSIVVSMARQLNYI